MRRSGGSFISVTTVTRSHRSFEAQRSTLGSSGRICVGGGPPPAERSCMAFPGLGHGCQPWRRRPPVDDTVKSDERDEDCSEVPRPLAVILGGVAATRYATSSTSVRNSQGLRRRRSSRPTARRARCRWLHIGHLRARVLGDLSAVDHGDRCDDQPQQACEGEEHDQERHPGYGGRD